jgi:hypothetical protein
LSKAVWDTEVNFGLRGPGSSPKTDFSDADGARLLQLAYSDSQELGIDQTFWYEFTAAPYDLLGVQMTPQTPAILAAWGGLPGYLAQQLPAQRAASICAPTSGGSSAGQDTPATPVAQSIIARGERPDTRESRVVVTVSAQGYRAGTELIVFFRRPGDRWQESTRTVTLDAKGNGEWSRNSGRTLRVYVKDPSTGIRSETTVIPAMQ